MNTAEASARAEARIYRACVAAMRRGDASLAVRWEESCSRAALRIITEPWPDTDEGWQRRWRRQDQRSVLGARLGAMLDGWRIRGMVDGRALDSVGGNGGAAC